MSTRPPLRIGLDVSMMATGICLRQGENVHFASLVNKYVFTSSEKMAPEEVAQSRPHLSALSKLPDVTLKFYERKSIADVKQQGLNSWNRLHYKACVDQAEELITFIKWLVVAHYPDVDMDAGEVRLIIENYSLGSVTNNLVQVIELTQTIKYRAIRRGLVTIDNLRIVPGPQIKSLAGNGGYDKFQMLTSFVENPNEDYVQDVAPFARFCKSNIDTLYANRTKKKKPFKEVLAPISDIIDAYFLTLFDERIPNDPIPLKKKKKKVKTDETPKPKKAK